MDEQDVVAGADVQEEGAVEAAPVEEEVAADEAAAPAGEEEVA